MKKPVIKFLFPICLLAILFSCKDEPKEGTGRAEIESTDFIGTDRDEGIHLKYFPSCEAIGGAIQFILKPGFKPSTKTSQVKKFAGYFSSYECSWRKAHPWRYNRGEYWEWIGFRGGHLGWDLNNEHEKTTKAEVLAYNNDYEEFHDLRLEKPPYKDHIIVLKKKDNQRGKWKFKALIDQTHYIDGDGQSLIFYGSFNNYEHLEKAEYEVPSEQEVVSVFLRLIEPREEALN